MKETIDLLGKILTNILTALYEPFGFSLLLSFLAMFFYLYAYEPIHAGKGWKNAIVTWYQKFKESVFFRKLFFLAFVTSLILFRTLLNRNLWMNPLSDAMGGWGIWETVNGEQKYHVRLLLDEFANIGLIPKFDKLIATIRSREISASIILQSQSQLKTIYKDAAETIIGNCDTMLFLGGKESSTLKEISETLGKETIDLYNTSDTRGQSPSFGTTYQKTGKELMSRDELSVMDGSKCILQLRGVRPFLSDKFDITKHKRYKELSDFDKKNAFDVERYLKHELQLRMDEEFDCYEVDLTPATEEATA